MKHLFFISLLCSSATQFAMLAPFRAALERTGHTALATQQARAYTVYKEFK